MVKNQLWKRVSAVVLAVLVSIPAGIMTSSEAKAAETIVVNGDFDNDTSIDISGWSIGEANMEAVVEKGNAIADDFSNGEIGGWTASGSTLSVADGILSASSGSKARDIQSGTASVPNSAKMSVSIKLDVVSAAKVTVSLIDPSSSLSTTLVTSGTTDDGAYAIYTHSFDGTEGYTQVAFKISSPRTYRTAMTIDDAFVSYEQATGEYSYTDGILMDGSDYAMKLSNGNSATYSATLTAGKWYKYSYDVHTEDAASGFACGLKLGDEIKTATSGMFQATEGMTIGFGTNGNGVAYFDNLVVTEPTVAKSVLTLNKAQAGPTAKTIYFRGSDSLAITGDDCSDNAWAGNRLTAVDGNENGIFLNGTKITPVSFIKYSSGLNSTHLCWYYLDLPANANDGDVLTIKGAFTLNDDIVQFTETTYTYTNDSWVEEIPADERTAVDFEQGHETKGYYLLASDSMPVVSWEEFIFPVLDGKSGVWVNDEWKNTPIKRCSEDKYYVCLTNGINGSACNAQPGDVIRFGGKYMYNGYVVEFAEISVIYDGTRWYEQKEAVDTRLTIFNAEQANGGDKTNCFYAGGFDGVPATGWEHEEDKSVNVAFLPFNEESGIWVGDTRVGGQFKKYAADRYYVEGFNAEVGQIVTIKGLFRSAAADVDLNVKESKFIFNGNYWEEVIDVADETGLTFTSIADYNSASRLGLVGADTHPVVSWDAVFKAAYGNDNGVFFNGNKIIVPIKRIDSGKYFVSLGEAANGAIAPKKNDKLVVKGVFTAKGYSVQYNETVLTYTGTEWVMGDVHFHEGVKTDAKESDCYEDGNIEYWTCECGKLFADEACTQEITLNDATIKASHTTVHMDAVAPGCHYNGNIEYWFCTECDGFWEDAACTRVTNSKSIILPATGSDNFTHVEAVAPTCISQGNIEYWFCPDCEQFWEDEACTRLTNSKRVIIGLADHDLVHMDAVAPACHYIGNVEYWYCKVCEGFWTNEACTEVTNSKNVILPATGSDNLVHVEAKEPTCNELGNIEYWHCPDCEQYWEDAACTRLTNAKRVHIGVVDHTLVHFDAVAPACHYIGNIEYWFCTGCEGFWEDEACTKVTNSKSVILPATGSENVVHVEAKAPTCKAEGNIEHWYCKDCEQFWQNEALTQLTNSKNVILGKVDHKAVKLPAVAAKIGKTGLTEGSKCSVCGTILKAQVKTPALKLAKPKASKITKTTGGKKQITVKFKKISGVTRYEIQYSLKKNMKGAKTVKVTKSKDMKAGKIVIKKLKAKKTYYVRIRTVKTVNGVTARSSWSKVLKAKKTK